MTEAEVDQIVEAGTMIHYPNGQTLTVTDYSAVGKGGVLYQTVRWAECRAERRAAWERRPWWRKALALPPKGYEPEGVPMSPGLLGNLFR